MPLEVTIDRRACAGAGECVYRAGATFALDAEGRVRLVDAAGDPESVVVAAATACPNFAIQVRRDGRTLV